MGLLPEAEPSEKGGGAVVEGIGGGEDAMFVQGAEEIVEHALDRLGGIAAALVLGGEGDAHFHLPPVFLQAVQAAIADDAACGGLDEGELEPGAGNVWLGGALGLDQTGCVVRAERFPGLIASHLRQGAVGAQRLRIAGVEWAQQETRGGQVAWEGLFHGV